MQETPLPEKINQLKNHPVISSHLSNKAARSKFDYFYVHCRNLIEAKNICMVLLTVKCS